MAGLASKVIATIHGEKRIRPRGWNRDELIKFMANKSGFRSLPAYDGESLSPENKARNTLVGWTVPDECFGRKPDVSQRNSLRAFIENVIIPAMRVHGDNGVAIGNVALHLEGDKVIVYRKK
jgi:hypothetical protein